MGRFKVIQKLDKCSRCNNFADYLIVEQYYGLFSRNKIHWDLICNECRLKEEEEKRDGNTN